MKTMTALVVAALAASPAVAQAGKPAQWERSPVLAEAVARASRSQALLLIKVSTAWCASCRRLDRVLSDKAVRAGLARFVRLAYDAEAGEGRDVARRYNVVTFPTVLVVGPDGVERDRVTGFMSGGALVKRLEEISKGRTLERMQRELRLRPDDLEFRLKVGTGWALKGERALAEKHLALVVAGDPNNAKGLAARAMLVRGKILLLRSLERFREAERVLRELRRRFPDALEAELGVYPLARALHGQGRTRAALRLLVAETSHQQAAERRASAHNALAWFCLAHRVQLELGLEHGRRATELAASEGSYWATRAQLHSALSAHRDAVKAWSRAVVLDPDDPWYRRRLDQQRKLLERQKTPK